MRRLSIASLTLLSAAALSALTGCALGPDYHGPQDASTPAQFSRASKAPSIRTSAPLAQWWKSLNDAELNNLIERALAANPDLDAARARLRSARAGTRLEQANRMPTVSGSAMAAKFRIPEISMGEQMKIDE